MERIPRMLWNRSWLLAGHPCLERWPPRGSRNVLEVLGRVLLIGWTQHRTPRMGFLQPNMPNWKGGCGVRLLFPNGEKQPQPCLKGTCHSMSLGSALGSSLAPLILLWWQNVVIFLFQFLWFNFHKPSFGTSGCSPTIIVHGACLEDHSRGRLPCSRSKAGNPWISNGSNSLKPKNPHCFTGSFAQRSRGVFLSKNPLVSTTGWPRNAWKLPTRHTFQRYPKVVLSVFALCHCWQVPYSNGFRNDMLATKDFQVCSKVHGSKDELFSCKQMSTNV